jgi:hypothetical protein
MGYVQQATSHFRGCGRGAAIRASIVSLGFFSRHRHRRLRVGGVGRVGSTRRRGRRRRSPSAAATIAFFAAAASPEAPARRRCRSHGGREVWRQKGVGRTRCGPSDGAGRSPRERRGRGREDRERNTTRRVKVRQRLCILWLLLQRRHASLEHARLSGVMRVTEREHVRACVRSFGAQGRGRTGYAEDRINRPPHASRGFHTHIHTDTRTTRLRGGRAGASGGRGGGRGARESERRQTGGGGGRVG